MAFLLFAISVNATSNSNTIPALVSPHGGSLINDFDHSGFARWSALFALSGATKILCQGEQWQNFATNKLNRQIEDAPLVRNWAATSELLDVGRNRAIPGKTKSWRANKTPFRRTDRPREASQAGISSHLPLFKNAQATGGR
jgi:hypothetical protein